MTQITQFSSLAIDANNPEKLATFWAAMLGGSIALDDDSDARVTAPTGPRLTSFACQNRRRPRAGCTSMCGQMMWRRRLCRRSRWARPGPMTSTTVAVASAAGPRGQRVLHLAA